MKNLALLIGSLALTLGIVVGVAVLFSAKASAPVKPVEAQLLVSDTPHTKGSREAKVTLVEFSDLQCPACRAAQPLVADLLKKNGADIFFIYRHYPLVQHLHSRKAARASEAAGKQDKFWEFHDQLFSLQDEWSGEADPNEKFLAYARELGLDPEQFAADLKDSSLDTRVSTDERDGNLAGVNATPTFFVNGIKTDTAGLSSAIESAIAGK